MVSRKITGILIAIFMLLGTHASVWGTNKGNTSQTRKAAEYQQRQSETHKGENQLGMRPKELTQEQREGQQAVLMNLMTMQAALRPDQLKQKKTKEEKAVEATARLANLKNQKEKDLAAREAIRSEKEAQPQEVERTSLVFKPEEVQFRWEDVLKKKEPSPTQRLTQEQQALVDNLGQPIGFQSFREFQVDMNTRLNFNQLSTLQKGVLTAGVLLPFVNAALQRGSEPMPNPSKSLQLFHQGSGTMVSQSYVPSMMPQTHTQANKTAVQRGLSLTSEGQRDTQPTVEGQPKKPEEKEVELQQKTDQEQRLGDEEVKVVDEEVQEQQEGKAVLVSKSSRQESARPVSKKADLQMKKPIQQPSKIEPFKTNLETISEVEEVPEKELVQQQVQQDETKEANEKKQAKPDETKPENKQQQEDQKKESQQPEQKGFKQGVKKGLETVASTVAEYGTYGALGVAAHSARKPLAKAAGIVAEKIGEAASAVAASALVSAVKGALTGGAKKVFNIVEVYAISNPGATLAVVLSGLLAAGLITADELGAFGNNPNIVGAIEGLAATSLIGVAGGYGVKAYIADKQQQKIRKEQEIAKKTAARNEQKKKTMEKKKEQIKKTLKKTLDDVRRKKLEKQQQSEKKSIKDILGKGYDPYREDIDIVNDEKN